MKKPLLDLLLTSAIGIADLAIIVGACFLLAHHSRTSHLIASLGPLLAFLIALALAALAGITAIALTGPRGIWWKISAACPLLYLLLLLLVQNPHLLAIKASTLPLAALWIATASGAFLVTLLKNVKLPP